MSVSGVNQIHPRAAPFIPPSYTRLGQIIAAIFKHFSPTVPPNTQVTHFKGKEGRKNELKNEMDNKIQKDKEKR